MKKRTTKSSEKLPEFKTSAEFDALTDAQKEAVFRSLDGGVNPSELRELTADERKLFEGFRRRSRGRPVVGNGAKQVAITVERDLLKRSDAFAKRNNLKRSELFAAGVNALMENPKLLKRKGAA